MTYKSLFIGSLACIAASASAQLNPTGPFVGTSSEDFESFQNYNVTSGVSNLPIMSGAATFTGSSEMWVYTPGSADWSLGGNGLAVVHGGANGLGLFNNQAPLGVVLSFANPVSAFGGYFADVDAPNFLPVEMTFFDEGGNQLGTAQTVTHGSNSMDWYGWSSVIGIKTIQFGAGQAPVMDDLQATAHAVPEPASMLVIGLGLVGLVRKRRKA